MDIHSGSFTGMEDPVDSMDSVNKRYVDNLVATVSSSVDRFINLKDTIKEYNQYRILYEDTGSVIDSSDLLFDTNNTFTVGGNILLKPKNTTNPKFYFSSSAGGQKIYLEVSSSGDLLFKSAINNIFHISDGKIGIMNFNPAYELDVNGDVKTSNKFRFNSRYLEQSGSYIKTDDDFFVNGILNVESAQIFYSQSLSPNTIYLMTKINNRDMIVSSAIT